MAVSAPQKARVAVKKRSRYFSEHPMNVSSLDELEDLLASVFGPQPITLLAIPNDELGDLADEIEYICDNLV